jgi:hypothetical protein
VRGAESDWAAGPWAELSDLLLLRSQCSIGHGEVALSDDIHSDQNVPANKVILVYLDGCDANYIGEIDVHEERFG